MSEGLLENALCQGAEASTALESTSEENELVCTACAVTRCLVQAGISG